jgi:acyl-coenzyme A thioesterase PaaI-like protein
MLLAAIATSTRSAASDCAEPAALAPDALDSELKEQLRAGLEEAIPFNAHNHVRICEVADGYGVAELPDAEHLKNHIGTQHGGALFAVAEAAAGAAYIGSFVEHIATIRMNAQEAHIIYMRWARGAITARSVLERSPRELLDVLYATGHVDLTMSCGLADSSHRAVGEMTFRFRLTLLSEREACPTGP